MAEPRPVTNGGNYLGWLSAGVLGIVLFAVVTGGNQSSVAAGNTANNSASDISAAADLAAKADTPLPLDVSAARRGYGQFQLIAAAHVPGSSEIFSQNCYEALGKPVDWHQLDRCGAYDALAARWAELNENSAGQDDLTYFQSEAAATRYLQAAAAGGLPGADADQRWASLQRMALGAHLARKRPEPEVPAAAATDQAPAGEDANTTANGGAANSAQAPAY